jgi:MAE_28990/MAE_18760-like HEPN
MFDKLLKTVIIDIDTVRKTIQINERLRGILLTKDSLAKQELQEKTKFLSLLEVLPIEIGWQVYDHCAAVTRLYAIYEHFVEDLISDWLRLLPELILPYSTLGEKIQNTHREGVGRLLLDLNKNRFQHLSVEKVIQGLFSGVTDTDKYELLPEAFLMHEQNLRKEVLEKLLADTGIENAWKWIVNYRKIKNFVEEVRGSQNTAEGELKQLVDYRNEAAHGSVDQILGIQELLDLCDFVESLCQSLAELVTYQLILQKKSVGQAKLIGTITEWFKQKNAAVAKVKEITLSVGDHLWLVSDSSSYCQVATIETIQINNIPKQQEQIISETEVGLKFDIDAKRGLSLYVID